MVAWQLSYCCLSPLLPLLHISIFISTTDLYYSVSATDLYAETFTHDGMAGWHWTGRSDHHDGLFRVCLKIILFVTTKVQGHPSTEENINEIHIWVKHLNAKLDASFAHSLEKSNEKSQILKSLDLKLLELIHSSCGGEWFSKPPPSWEDAGGIETENRINVKSEANVKEWLSVKPRWQVRSVVRLRLLLWLVWITTKALDDINRKALGRLHLQDTSKRSS